MIQAAWDYFFPVEGPSVSGEVSNYEIKAVGQIANHQEYAPSITKYGIPFVNDNNIWLYDLKTNEISHLMKPSIPVYECQSNGRYVACGFLIATEVLLFDLEDKTTTKLKIEGFGYPEMVNVLDLNENWMVGIMGFDKHYFLTAYNLTTDAPSYLEISESVIAADGNCAFIGPDTLALYAYDETIVIDLNNMKIVQTLKTSKSVTLAASGESKAPLVTVNPSGEVNFWDIVTGEKGETHKIPHDGEFQIVEVLDSERLAYFVSSPSLGSVIGILDRTSNDVLFEKKLPEKELEGVESYATLAIKETQTFVVSPQQHGGDMIVYHFDQS